MPFLVDRLAQSPQSRVAGGAEAGIRAGCGIEISQFSETTRRAFEFLAENAVARRAAPRARQAMNFFGQSEAWPSTIRAQGFHPLQKIPAGFFDGLHARRVAVGTKVAFHKNTAAGRQLGALFKCRSQALEIGAILNDSRVVLVVWPQYQAVRGKQCGFREGFELPVILEMIRDLMAGLASDAGDLDSLGAVHQHQHLEIGTPHAEGSGNERPLAAEPSGQARQLGGEIGFPPGGVELAARSGNIAREGAEAVGVERINKDNPGIQFLPEKRRNNALLPVLGQEAKPGAGVGTYRLNRRHR